LPLASNQTEKLVWGQMLLLTTDVLASLVRLIGLRVHMDHVALFEQSLVSELNLLPDPLSERLTYVGVDTIDHILQKRRLETPGAN
jgi:hypothetical protein